MEMSISSWRAHSIIKFSHEKRKIVVFLHRDVFDLPQRDTLSNKLTWPLCGQRTFSTQQGNICDIRGYQSFLVLYLMISNIFRSFHCCFDLRHKMQFIRPYLKHLFDHNLKKQRLGCLHVKAGPPRGRYRLGRCLAQRRRGLPRNAAASQPAWWWSRRKSVQFRRWCWKKRQTK